MYARTQWLGFHSKRGQVAPVALLPLPRSACAAGSAGAVVTTCTAGAGSTAGTVGTAGTVCNVSSVCSVLLCFG